MEGGVSGTLNIVEMMCDNERVIFSVTKTFSNYNLHLVRYGDFVGLGGPVIS